MRRDHPDDPDGDELQELILIACLTLMAMILVGKFIVAIWSGQ